MTARLGRLAATLAVLCCLAAPAAATEIYFHPQAASMPSSNPCLGINGPPDNKYVTCAYNATTDQSFYLLGGWVPQSITTWSTGWGYTIKWMQDAEASGETCWAVHVAVIKDGQDAFATTYSSIGETETDTSAGSGTDQRSATSSTGPLKDITGTICDAGCLGMPLRVRVYKLRDPFGDCSNSNGARFLGLAINGP